MSSRLSRLAVDLVARKEFTNVDLTKALAEADTNLNQLPLNLRLKPARGHGREMKLIATNHDPVDDRRTRILGTHDVRKVDHLDAIRHLRRDPIHQSVVFRRQGVVGGTNLTSRIRVVIGIRAMTWPAHWQDVDQDEVRTAGREQPGCCIEAPLDVLKMTICAGMQQVARVIK